jgi:hypothetical protein
MITSRSQSGSRAIPGPSDDRLHEFHQDRSGPLDGELLDLYVAIFIAVPLAFLLKSVWF